MNEELENFDWSKTTFEGAELENLRGWQQLSFDEKLLSNESMNEMFNDIVRRKIERGEPYFDPDTGEFVPGRKSITSAARVAEETSPYSESLAPRPEP